MAKSRRKTVDWAATTHLPPPEPDVPTLPPMSDAEREASHRAYLACKPVLDAAMAKIDGRSRSAMRDDAHPNLPERIKSGPNVAYVCLDHSMPLDPWGICHHGCARCLREALYQRIWTHKGSCRPKRAELKRMVAA